MSFEPEGSDGDIESPLTALTENNTANAHRLIIDAAAMTNKGFELALRIDNSYFPMLTEIRSFCLKSNVL